MWNSLNFIKILIEYLMKYFPYVDVWCVRQNIAKNTENKHLNGNRLNPLILSSEFLRISTFSEIFLF